MDHFITRVPSFYKSNLVRCRKSCHTFHADVFNCKEYQSLISGGVNTGHLAGLTPFKDLIIFCETIIQRGQITTLWWSTLSNLQSEELRDLGTSLAITVSRAVWEAAPFCLNHLSFRSISSTSLKKSHVPRKRSPLQAWCHRRIL